MSLTSDAVYWHEEYENASTDVRKAVDEAYKEARHVLNRVHGLPTANDDRAEELIAALTKYVVQSGE